MSVVRVRKLVRREGLLRRLPPKLVQRQYAFNLKILSVIVNFLRSDFTVVATNATIAAGSSCSDSLSASSMLEAYSPGSNFASFLLVRKKETEIILMIALWQNG